MTMGDRIRPSRTPGKHQAAPTVNHCNTPPDRPGGAADTPNPAINPTPGLDQRPK